MKRKAAMEINNIGRLFANIATDEFSAPLKEAGDKSFEERLKAAVEKNDDGELKAACKQFEGIMLDIIYKQMKATINRSNLVKADVGRNIFESMLDETMMDNASQLSTFGLADSLYKQLSRQKASDSDTKQDKTAEGAASVEKQD